MIALILAAAAVLTLPVCRWLVKLRWTETVMFTGAAAVSVIVICATMPMAQRTQPPVESTTTHELVAFDEAQTVFVTTRRGQMQSYYVYRPVIDGQHPELELPASDATFTESDVPTVNIITQTWEPGMFWPFPLTGTRTEFAVPAGAALAAATH